MKRSVILCPNDEKKKKNARVSTSVTKKWEFRVESHIHLGSHETLMKDEKLCITGDCEQLGNWKADKVIVLNKENDFYNITLDIPADVDVHYRYCICLIDNKTKEILVTKWETHMDPRKIKSSDSAPSKDAHVFGINNGEIKIGPGWLSAGRLTQFKFYDKPFQFYKTNTNNYDNLSIKITPVKSGFNICDYDVLDFENMKFSYEADNTLTRVAVLSNKEKCKFKKQEFIGVNYSEGDFILFNIMTCSRQLKLSYIMEFFNVVSEGSSLPTHIGYCFILSEQLTKSEGEFKLPIICPNKHRPMGLLCGEYINVLPMTNTYCDMEKSYSSYWKSTWTGLEVGHRGNGASFGAEDNIVRENTIASINIAKNHGADMVEFDVQLTKDMVPVIYHDFNICLPLKYKQGHKHGDQVIQIPLKDLTCDQLQNMKSYHVGEIPSSERFHDTELKDNQPFPLLADFMSKIDENLGYDVEIKWPMKKEDGTMPLKDSIDMNTYLDKILEIVLCNGGSRQIFFSCFNPEVCLMLSLKQNLYPVIFLTQGVTNKWEKLSDPRCNTIPYAIFNSLNSNLLGIAAHTEDLLRDPSQVISVKEAGLVLFCWGSDNNDKKTIQHLKEMGLHGIIFDRMDIYSSK